MDWNSEEGLKTRLQMYKEFRKDNPQVVGIAPLLFAISVFQLIYTLVKLIAYFAKLDLIIFQQHAIKATGKSDVKFSPELENYIQETI